MSYNRYKMYSGYNAWANSLIYEAASHLSDSDYRANRGAFFKSVHGTLNHMLGADQFWMHRFTGQGAFPASLDAILFDKFNALKAARVAMDERIIAFVTGLNHEVLAPSLDHFFNHHTHHRGQIHALLTGFGLDAPSLDLVQYNRALLV